VTISLEGKTALVTGAGRGIGRAIAIELAKAGASVALIARSRDELEETASHALELGGDPLVITADIGEPRELARAVQRAIDEFRGVDILVNNAAVVWPLGPSVAVDPAWLGSRDRRQCNRRRIPQPGVDAWNARPQVGTRCERLEWHRESPGGHGRHARLGDQ